MFSCDKIADTHTHTDLLLTCACMAKQHISLMKRKFAKTFLYEFFLCFLLLTALSLSEVIQPIVFFYETTQYVNMINRRGSYRFTMHCEGVAGNLFFLNENNFFLPTLNFFAAFVYDILLVEIGCGLQLM